MSVYEILSLIACATTQISLHTFKVSPELSCTNTYLHGIALPEFLHSSFFYKKSKQARVPTFVCLFCDDATTANGPGCDEGTNSR